MNSFTAVGYVKRPEARITTTGKSVLKFALAIPNPKREGQEKTGYTYCNCQFWGADETPEEGAKVMVHGSYYNSSYDKKDGSKGYDSGMNVQTLAYVNSKGKIGRAVQGQAPDPVEQDLPF